MSIESPGISRAQTPHFGLEPLDARLILTEGTRSDAFEQVCDWGAREVRAGEVLGAVFGGSLSLAGILLIFVGFLYSQAQSFPSGTAETITNRYKLVAKVGVLPFAIALLDAALAFNGMLHTPAILTTGVVYLCWAELVLLAVYGLASMLFYLQ